MSIIIDNKSCDNNKYLKKSKYIVCPKCNDLTKINIKDYRISLNGCQKDLIELNNKMKKREEDIEAFKKKDR